MRSYSKAFSDLSDFAQENFSGIAVIKAFVKELKELLAFRKLNKENEEINVTYTKIATLLEARSTPSPQLPARAAPSPPMVTSP